MAAVAVAALLRDDHKEGAHTVNGPELLNWRTKKINAAIGEEVRFKTVASHEAKRLYRQGGFPAGNADGNPAEAATFDPTVLGLPPTIGDAIGSPARTFARWALDHADDFRGTACCTKGLETAPEVRR